MLLAVTWGPSVMAGGSGLNVVVVVNQNSTNSVQLGNYYCEKRGVPSQNLLRITWTGGNVGWTLAEMESALRTPLNAMLAGRSLSNQIDYVALSMDIPYRVDNSAGTVNNNFNGTTSALFYGFKDNPADTFVACTLANGSTNQYAGSESIYRATPPINAASNSWLAIMLTGTNLAAAKALVDRGVASDATFPAQTAYLAKSYDVIRSSRFVLFDDAIFDARVHGGYSLRSTNTSTSSGLGSPLLGFQNGVQQFDLAATTFVPGAIADNLTSFSGYLFEVTGHTGVMDFLNAGATASFGTVTEPCAYLEKFASPRNYFYQARGFSIAECYYQSITCPYLGVLVGEPLAAPFAVPAAGAWAGLANNALLAGTTNLTVQWVAPDAGRPVQQVDLFVDGVFSQTLTNIAPRPNNLLYVSINGFPTNCPVPPTATLKSLASNLALRLNAAAYSNATKVAAVAYGDRIELRSLNPAVAGSNVTIAVSNSPGTASLLTASLGASRPNFLDAIGFAKREFVVVGALVVGDYLGFTITKTNGQVVAVSVTNQSPTATFVSFVRSLLDAVNAEPALQAPDGLVAEDMLTGSVGVDPAAQFNLRARAAGIGPAQIQANFTGSFSTYPSTIAALDENLSDLQPRNHLYLAAGLTNLNLTFPLNTTTNADGYHELTAVAYEGSHVRTQKRLSQTVRFQNNGWTATLTSLLGGTNTALEATLEFAVAANTNNIVKIELFSTGGSLGASNSVNSATFAVPASYLQVGLHPFYAVVTRNDGKQYRTDTKWIRIVGAESPFPVSVVSPIPTLTWPATAGRGYSILSATDVTAPFTLRGGVLPTNSIGWWSETNSSAVRRFYRVTTP